MASRTQGMAQRLQQSRTRTADDLVATLRQFGEPLPELRHPGEFGAAFDRFGSAQVVLLGEATHGTSEFYRARAAITRRLIEQHGFSIVAVEADWPDAARIDAYVRHFAPKPERDDAFTRFPQWMWRNDEVAAFVDWLRVHNRDVEEAQRVSFRGLDIYSLGASIASVLEYLDRRDPARAAEARQRYGCLTPWQEDPAFYGREVLLGAADACEAEVVAQLQELLEQRLVYLKDDGEEFFDAAQNARVVRSAEQYYRLMYRSYGESWNLRDRHMFDTLQALLRSAHRLGKGAAAPKAVIWAHNSHVGNAAATAMGWQGEFNIGELCRKAYGADAVLIGFGTDRGTVAAASDWGAPMEIKSVRPARSDSYEHAFREAGHSRSLTEWRFAAKARLSEQLSASLLERAIGVIYRPESELQSHYFESALAEQFDAWVWFEETSAVMPLAAGRATGMPETYPFGM
ncbi:MAG: erythromycin esterase family protein [Steroidobacter sp.]